MMHEDARRLSVVVCTYNRAEILRLCLDSLIAQEGLAEPPEILVIDNNSTDATRELVADYAERNSHIRYVREEKQGLSHARNRGWQEADSEYVAYLDDDAKAPPHWVKTALEIIQREHPAVFGGPYQPYYLTQKPEWFRDAYGSHELGEHKRLLQEGETVSGGNFVVKRDLLRELRGFDSSYGMTGARIGIGEETALQLQLRRCFPNCKILYDPELMIDHLVPASKMHIGYCLKRVVKAGKDVGRLNSQNEKRSPYFLLAAFSGCLLLLLWRWTLGLLIRNRSQYPTWQNYVVEQIEPYLGQACSYWQRLLSKIKLSPILSRR